MIWLFAAICLFGLTFFKLGAVSVMAKLLTLGLLAALLVIGVLLIVLVWTKITQQRQAQASKTAQ